MSGAVGRQQTGYVHQQQTSQLHGPVPGELAAWGLWAAMDTLASLQAMDNIRMKA